jgi:sugar phosphate isomerase/epimerase
LPWERASCRFAEMFEALIATKYKGFVDLEYEIHGDDPMPGVIEALPTCGAFWHGMGLRNANA